MRLALPSRGHPGSGPNLTALVDVVFVILIFLMLAGSFGGKTHFLQCVSTGRGRITHCRDPFAGLSRIDLFISRSPDRVGFMVRALGIAPTGDVSLLTERLTGQATALAAAGAERNTLEVVLRPDPDVSFQQVASVYDAVGRARICRLAFGIERNVHQIAPRSRDVAPAVQPVK